MEGGERVAGNAINPDASGGEIAARWRNNPPQIAVIDNVLSDEALAKLREFAGAQRYGGGRISCASAQPPTGKARPVLRAGFTDVLVTEC